MIHKDEDRIIYLASLYKRLEKLGEMDYKIYPEGLFDVEDKPNLQSSNAEQEKDKQ